MADGNIKVQVSTQAARSELERLRAENAALKRDLQYARDGLTKGRTRMREDNARLLAEVEALRLDAGRWRWWRQRWTALCGYNCAREVGLDLSKTYVNNADKMDAVTDAAMAAQEKA